MPKTDTFKAESTDEATAQKVREVLSDNGWAAAVAKSKGAPWIITGQKTRKPEKDESNS